MRQQQIADRSSMSGTLDGLSAAVDEVFRDIREKFREASKEAKIWEYLQAFAAAVDWTVMAWLHAAS